MSECRVCGKKLKHVEEYICDECFDKKMKKDMEAYAKNQERESDGEYERDEQYSIDWRFRNSQNRSVFKNYE
jgi:ribosomal protein L37E